MGLPICFTKQLGAASSNSIATSQSPGTAALTLTSAKVTIDAATANNTAVGRRVIITSGGNDSGINWTVVGTNGAGNVISDTFPGSSGGAAQSNLDFVTVTSITPSAAVAGTATAGTNGVASSPWIVLNTATTPMNVGFAVELVSGSCNFTVQHTYDDPNNLLAGATSPLAISSPVVVGSSATTDGVYAMPIAAIRVLINSGTGVIRTRVLQSGIG